MTRRRPTRPGSTKVLLAALLLPLAFWLGRRSAALDAVPHADDDSSPADSSGGLRPPAAATSTVAHGSPKLTALTSTIPLCPCPVRKEAHGSKGTLAIKRRRVAPLESRHERSDPTAATAEYLRDRVRTLAACAPRSLGEVRVHIEVTVSPLGKIDRVRVTNMEPLPPSLAECVETAVLRFEPPPFDGAAPETFALTVVL